MRVPAPGVALLLALGAASAQAEPLPVQIEAQTGREAPLGRAGLAVVAQPTARLAIGAGLGLPGAVTGWTSIAAAGFGRLRLGTSGPFALDFTGGGSLAPRERALTVRRPDRADEVFVQRWRAALRLHAGLGASARLGAAVARVEAGASLGVGGPDCLRLEQATARYERCDRGPMTDVEPPDPSRIAPYVLVSLGFAVGSGDVEAMGAPGDAPLRQQLSLVVEASPLAETQASEGSDLPESGHDARGVAVDYVRRAGAFFRYGMGVRYEQDFGGAVHRWPARSLELVSIPLSIGVAGRGVVSDHELETTLGVGPLLAWPSRGAIGGDDGVRAWGATAELAVTYVYPLGPRTGLTFGAALRMSFFERIGGRGDAEGFHVVAPLRLGLRRRF
jgi:hypothetical protein